MNDSISRQDAYNTLTEYYHHRTETQHEALKEALERVPDAEPDTSLYVDGFDDGFKAGTQRWIPVVEKEPEEWQKAICTNKHNEMMIGTYTNFGWTFPCYFETPIAWMPLPDPYEEEEE